MIISQQLFFISLTDAVKLCM